MPPAVTEGLDSTSILLGVVGVLSAVTAFFLVRFINLHDRFVKEHDERNEKIAEALNGILTRLAVHDEKHERHDARLEHLEERKK
jgi:hypothetical protein